MVEITSPQKQNFDGSAFTVRAQILSVQPVLSDAGRFYKTKALTFEPAFADGTEFTINTDSNNINLHTLVGGPASAVNVTIIIDGCTVGSNNPSNAALVAGSFASGSTIEIILKNSAVIQGAGGLGGGGGTSIYINIYGPSTINSPGFAGGAGGTAYDSQGIDTDIYLGGTIGSHTALGELRAPGGGGGGEDGQGSLGTTVGGGGGGGGAGSQVGSGGSGGTAVGGGGFPATNGTDGADGTVTGTGGAAGGAGAGAGGGWGVAGSAGDAAGGAAGSGIIKGGATVNISTSGNTGRFTNGNGDSPDSLT